RGYFRAVAPFEDSDDVFFVARKCDHVDWIRIVAAGRADHVARTFTVAVTGAIVDAGRANLAQRIGRLYPRRAQVEFVLGRRRRDGQFSEIEPLRHPLRHMLLLIGSGTLAFVAPSPEFPFALGHRAAPPSVRLKPRDFAPHTS